MFIIQRIFELSYFKSWGKVFDYDGKASRYEFFIFLFTNVLILGVMIYLDGKLNGLGDIVSWIFNFVDIRTYFPKIALIPSVALTVRRLHDANYSGAWVLSMIFGIIIISLSLLYLILNAFAQSIGRSYIDTPYIYTIFLPLGCFLILLTFSLCLLPGNNK